MMTIALCAVKNCAHVESKHDRTTTDPRDDYCLTCYEDGSDLAWHSFKHDDGDEG